MGVQIPLRHQPTNQQIKRRSEGKFPSVANAHCEGALGSGKVVVTFSQPRNRSRTLCRGTREPAPYPRLHAFLDARGDAPVRIDEVALPHHCLDGRVGVAIRELWRS